MILNAGSRDRRRAEPVSRAVGAAVRRPVSLLLAELLLDDELELEAAGAALEDVRRDGRRRSSRGTAARCRPSRASSWSRRSAPRRRTRTTSCAPLAPRSSSARSCAAVTSRHGSPSAPGGCSSRKGGRCWSGRWSAARGVRSTTRTPARSAHRRRRPARRRRVRARCRRQAARRPPGATSARRQLLRRSSGAIGRAGAAPSCVRTRRRDGPPAPRGRRRRGGDRQEPPRRRVRRRGGGRRARGCMHPVRRGDLVPAAPRAGRSCRRRSTTGPPMLGELSSADAALAAARALFEHFTASGSVVVVLDDVHWAVPTFLDLVEYVVRAVDGPLLVDLREPTGAPRAAPGLGRGGDGAGVAGRRRRPLASSMRCPSARRWTRRSQRRSSRRPKACRSTSSS